MAELRRDPSSGNWVVVGYEKKDVPPGGGCPFCPGNEHLTPPPIREVKDSKGDWRIRVVPALNPVFVIEAQENKRGEGLYDKMGNVGAHEIIVEHREHGKKLGNFTADDLSIVLSQYMERIVDLKKDKRFRYVQVFRNQGELSGSSIHHPHGHILGTPIMPKRIDLELANAKIHHNQKERCILCDEIRQEIRQEIRLVAVNDHFVAFCPFASRFPFETLIAPRHHEDSFEAMRDPATASFIHLFLNVIKRLEAVVPSYSVILHTSPNIPKHEPGTTEESFLEYFHWHVEILPKDSQVAKYKTEDEFYVIATTPEKAARTLRSLDI